MAHVYVAILTLIAIGAVAAGLYAGGYLIMECHKLLATIFGPEEDT